jgi:hypothetical protein
MRLHHPVALLTAIACTTCGFAAESDRSVQVKDVAVTPRANLTFDNGTLRLNPKAMLGGGFNSNVFAERDGQENDDSFIHGLIGLEADWRLNPHNSFQLNGELETVTYTDSDNDEGDLVGGLLAADYRWHEANNDLRLHAGYARFDDPLIQTGEQILRQNIDGHARLTLQGATVRTVVEFGATALDYLEDGIGFTQETRDNTVYRLVGRMGVTTARDTYYYALVGVDLFDYWENTVYNDSNGVTAGLGAQVRLGERSTLTAEAGATMRMYDDNFLAQTAYDDEDYLAPYLSIAARWPWESGSQVGLNAFSRIDESLTANAAWVYGAQLDGRYRLLADAGLFGALGFYHSEDSGQGVGIELEERDTLEVSGGLDYTITRGLVGRLKGTYTDSEATISNDFTRYIIAVDLAAAF